MEHVKRIVRLEQKNKYEGNCYMYLDMIRIGEKVMESCWYSLCVYKKETEKRYKIYIVKKRRNEKLKKNEKKKVHELSSSQD